MLTVITHQSHRAIESGSGIPTGTFLKISQMNHNLVSALSPHSILDAEGIVTVSPSASLPAVDVHHRLGHGAIEDKFVHKSSVTDFNCRPVITVTYPRERTGTAALFRLFSLSVLLDGNILKIPFLIERTAYCPVMRDSYFLPAPLVAAEAPLSKIFLCPVLP